MKSSDDAKERRLDAVGAVVVMIIATGVFVAARREPPAFYDPLGPGTAPAVVSAILFSLGMVLLARALLGKKTGQSAQSMILGMDADEPVDYRLRPGLAAFSLAATAAYTAAIGLGLPFVWSTLAFLFLLGTAMADFKVRLTAWVFLVSVIGAFLVEYLFRTVLLVQLP